MKKNRDEIVEFNDEKLDQIRKDVNELKKNPKFNELSTAFKETLVNRMGIKGLEDGGSVIRGVIPIPLKHIIDNSKLPKEELAKKLQALTVSVESIMEVTGAKTPNDLLNMEKLQIDPNDLKVHFDPEDFKLWGDEGGFYFNIYSYNFW